MLPRLTLQSRARSKRLTRIPGQTWRKKITAELDDARCVIVLWSQTSVDSHWVEQEADEGQRRKILVPALIDRVTIPLGFRNLQAANLVGWDGTTDHHEFQKILRAIEECAPIAAAGTANTSTAPVRIANSPQQQENLVTIPAGTFWMGAQNADKKARNYDPEARDDESPVHQVTLTSFRIARFPVTVKEFARFVDSGGYSEHKHWAAGGFGGAKEPDNWSGQQKHSDWPVAGVSWFEASAYCAWAGLRLPTEAEWERVARGPNSARYPWGDNPKLDHTRANYGSKTYDPTPQGHYAKGRSAEGIDDLLGNAWEWCADWHAGYSAGPAENPRGPKTGEYKILRGGSWDLNPRYARVSDRGGNGPTERFNDFGFRCAAEVP